MDKRIRILAATSLAIGTFQTAAHATCTDTQADTSATDTVVSTVNPCGSQRSSNIGIMAGDLDLQLADDWGSRGANDTCNTADELAKQLNAFMLVTLGVSYDNSPNFSGISLHASDCNGGDYCNLAGSTSKGGWHNWFRDIAEDSSDGNLGVFQTRTGPIHAGQPDLVILTCGLYDKVGKGFGNGAISAGNPAFRAEAIVHEAWHAWEHSHGHEWDTDCGHERCPDTNKTGDGFFCKAGMECDSWFPHGVTTPGAMVNQMHRPYQVMNEFACDLVDTPQDWVPLSVREIAKQDAAFFGEHNTLRGPMPGCDSGVSAGLVDGVCGLSSNQCDQDTPCTGGTICDASSGCCVTPPTCMMPGLATCDGTCNCNFDTSCCPAPAPPPK